MHGQREAEKTACISVLPEDIVGVQVEGRQSPVSQQEEQAQRAGDPDLHEKLSSWSCESSRESKVLLTENGSMLPGVVSLPLPPPASAYYTVAQCSSALVDFESVPVDLI